MLVIDSNMDSVVDGWSPEVESAIPAEIKKSDEYKNFQRDLSFVKRQREEKTLVMREFLDSIESNLREKTEPIISGSIYQRSTGIVFEYG